MRFLNRCTTCAMKTVSGSGSLEGEVNPTNASENSGRSCQTCNPDLQGPPGCRCQQLRPEFSDAPVGSTSTSSDPDPDTVFFVHVVHRFRNRICGQFGKLHFIFSSAKDRIGIGSSNDIAFVVTFTRLLKSPRIQVIQSILIR